MASNDSIYVILNYSYYSYMWCRCYYSLNFHTKYLNNPVIRIDLKDILIEQKIIFLTELYIKKVTNFKIMVNFILRLNQ